MKDDLISRQAAIDVINVGEELLRRVLDDTDVVGAERAKYEWGLGLIESYIADMKVLPSAQPERKPYHEEWISALRTQPERKPGKWVGAIEYCKHLEETTGERYQPSGLAGMIYCNQCWHASDRRSNYCRECGAKMEEGEEHETD